MTALDRKLLRDLWHMRGQAMAIAMVLAAATATFVLAFGVQRSLTQTRDAYYERNGFADVFAGMTRAPRNILPRIASVPGVREAEGVIRQYATLDLPGRAFPVRALLISLPEGDAPRLNRLTLQAGRLPSPGVAEEVVADAAFAEASGLSPGSRIEAVIYGRKQSLRIVGIGLSPEYVYSLAPGDLIPDPSRFGILWMGERALEAATDRMGAINAVSLDLEPHAVEANVIRRIDAILAPYGGTGAHGRADQFSHAFLENELTQLDAMSKVIPPVFLLVAAFLVYVVLNRMIGNERAQIGLLKAFGYSDLAIAFHYLKLAVIIALAATFAGSLAGIWMGREMTQLYAAYFRFPVLEYHVVPVVMVGAAALALLTTVLGSLAPLRAAARLAPAVAMTLPAPPVYRPGLLQRMGEAAGFTPIGHMIARHIARFPGRSAITTLGVALSLALLFATLQFLDATRVMLDSYFYRAQGQDLTVTLTEPRSEAVLHEFRHIPGVLRAEPSRAVPVKLHFGSRTEHAAIESAREDALLTSRIDGDGRMIALPPRGLMLSRQLARKLNVAAGDSVQVELLGGRQITVAMPVARIVDEYVGERAYAGQATLQDIARDAAPVGAVLLKVDPAMRAAVLARLKQMPLVLGVTEREAAMQKFEEMIDDNLYTMLFFYISFASAIAVGVVYNSARILFSERAHELATLRVLGYFRREVGAVLLGELALLVLLAVPLGCFLGYWLAQVMTAMFSSDLFRLPFSPARASYGLASVVVLLAALLTSLGVAMRVARLDLVRVLKGRD